MSKDDKKSVLVMPEELISDMNDKLPGNLTMSDLQRLFYGRKIKVCFYMSEELIQSDIFSMELSVRATNALKRAGYNTVGELVSSIDSDEELKKLRACGSKTISEIMGRLLFFQYAILPAEQRRSYMRRLLEINGIK